MRAPLVAVRQTKRPKQRVPVASMKVANWKRDGEKVMPLANPIALGRKTMHKAKHINHAHVQIGTRRIRVQPFASDLERHAIHVTERKTGLNGVHPSNAHANATATAALQVRLVTAQTFSAAARAITVVRNLIHQAGTETEDVIDDLAGDEELKEGS